MARKSRQIEAYMLTKAEKREGRKSRHKSPVAGVHDRQATGLPKGVIPAVVSVPCPSGDGSTLKVIRNMRRDPVSAMEARKQLAFHQAEAARRWQVDYEGAQLGAVKAMDPMKEPVDGSPPRSDPINDRQRKCLTRLRDADARLGTQGGVLVRLVLVDCLSIQQVAERYGDDTKIMRDRLGWLLRQCLDELAKIYGLADRRLATVEA